MVTVFALPVTVEILVEVTNFVIVPPGLVMVDVLVTVLPRPGMVTVLPGVLTVETRVDVTTTVLCPPPTVTVDGRPVTVTVLP